MTSTRLQAVQSAEAGLSRLLRMYDGYILRSTQFVLPGDAIRPDMDPVWITPLSDKRYEMLVTDVPTTCEVVDDIRVRFSADLGYFEVRADDAADLTSTVEAAYQRVFAVIKRLRDHKLLRIWNYIPCILRGTDEHERYRLFNAGRFAAWQKYGPKDGGGAPLYPASTGIGAYSGPLIIQVLLTRAAVRHVQNFRQVPAASYSSKFGKRPPVFARGSLRHGASWSEIIVSGTASVVGEETAHECACDQSVETVKNLRALLSAKNLGGTGFGLWQMHSVRAYVKRREDLGRVKQEIERHVIADHIIYLLNDICRPGLLMEVEGIAG